MILIFLKEFVLPLLKVWQSLNLIDDCLGDAVPQDICIYQSGITSYMSLSSERELTLTRSTSRFMCCWDVLNCHRLFLSDCAIRWHFYNNSKFTVDMYPLDYSTCTTLILLLVAVLPVYTIMDWEVLMRDVHRKQWCALLANCEIQVQTAAWYMNSYGNASKQRIQDLCVYVYTLYCIDRI